MTLIIFILFLVGVFKGDFNILSVLGVLCVVVYASFVCATYTLGCGVGADCPMG